MHIHYTSGPAVLADVSFELTNQIQDLLKQGVSADCIVEDLDVSSDIVEEVNKIYRAGLRRCCFCGELFDSKGHSRRITCYKPEHYLPCIDCGALVKVKESYALYMKAGGRRCPTCRAKQIGLTRSSKSQEEKDAILAKQQSTMMERYGATNPAYVPEMKAKREATVKERYGVDNLSQSPEIQNKIRENSRKKYGVDHYSNAPEVRKRMKDGLEAKYGVRNAQQSPEIRQKTRDTNIKKYGAPTPLQNEEVRRKFINNHIAKYGVAWPRQRSELIERTRQTNIERYGAAMYPVSDAYMRTFISDPDKFDNYKAFLEDPKAYIESHYSTKPSVKQLSEDLGVTDSPIYDKLISIGQRDLATEFAYSMETQVIEFLTKLDPDLQIIKHNRSILNGKEIDIYLPDYQIGFECNPTYTHNSSFNDPWGSPPKHWKYHYEKSQAALQKGVFIYHIFGYEWTHRRSLIMSQICNLFGKNSRKIFARNTEVIELSYPESCNFLEANHRQGAAQASVRLALKMKDSEEIVSLMTFGKMRPGIGKKKTQSDDGWELIRFCSLQNTSVIGAASKLFKRFLDDYNPRKVVSFSDVAHTRGTLYETLGFTRVSLSDPGYVWVNLKDDSFYNRVTCQKQNIPNLFNDVNEDDILKSTESELMMSHGFARVYDSGVIRWEYEH